MSKCPIDLRTLPNAPTDPTEDAPPEPVTYCTCGCGLTRAEVQANCRDANYVRNADARVKHGR